MTKQQILDHVRDIPADSLFEFICCGKVTLEELMKTGNLMPEKRIDIEIKIRNHEQVETGEWEGCRHSGDESKIMEYITLYPAGKYLADAHAKIREMRAQKEYDEWEAVKYSNVSKIRDFIEKNPESKHVEEAKRKIDQIEEESRNARRKHEQVINEIRLNRNFYTPVEIQEFINKDIISVDDLRKCQIPEPIISKVLNHRRLDIELGETPQFIPDGFTEVYFWGIPSSGKTCALAAILNTAEKHGYMKIGKGTGTKYIFNLKNLFRTEDNIGYLPEGTRDSTQYLPFTLKDMKEKNSRSVSLIELSGEVFKCFAKKYIDHSDSLYGMEETFATLDRYLLNTNNRKIHFFFIDYDPTAIAQDQYTQSDYMNGAISYFEEKKVFTKSTDAIFVVITKSDLIDGYHTDDKKLIKAINDYLDKNFKSFDHYLTEICRKLSINGGRPIILPFSIGDVYFKRICKINRNRAEIILNYLFERIKPQKKSILDVFNK